MLSMADGDHGGKPKICNGAAILHILAMAVKSCPLLTVHEMAMVFAARKLRRIISGEDWQKEKCDFIQSLSKISTLPKTNMTPNSNGGTRPGQIVSVASMRHVDCSHD
ncbi:hypothetical protein TSUD_280000 [Trifolium subterraneum]|uniref:Uncharacterized protein n=1 Tax=Trifolium subterraneum TaxID=3900 RepID=A0A2Z6MPF6_TRISU|nr:hypothetical protein TSUD_280000 [Trifolium subterraneum]